MKHRICIGLSHYVMWYMMNNHKILVRHVPAESEYANMFTKSLQIMEIRTKYLNVHIESSNGGSRKFLSRGRVSSKAHLHSLMHMFIA